MLCSPIKIWICKFVKDSHFDKTETENTWQPSSAGRCDSSKVWGLHGARVWRSVEPCKWIGEEKTAGLCNACVVQYVAVIKPADVSCLLLPMPALSFVQPSTSDSRPFAKLGVMQRDSSIFNHLQITSTNLVTQRAISPNQELHLCVDLFLNSWTSKSRGKIMNHENQSARRLMLALSRFVPTRSGCNSYQTDIFTFSTSHFLDYSANMFPWFCSSFFTIMW